MDHSLRISASLPHASAVGAVSRRRARDRDRGQEFRERLDSAQDADAREPLVDAGEVEDGAARASHPEDELRELGELVQRARSLARHPDAPSSFAPAEADRCEPGVHMSLDA